MRAISFWNDTRGSGAGAQELTMDLATQVIASEKEGCIGAVDFLEAQRAGAQTPETVRCIRPQVQRVPAVIRTMPPRQAPETLDTPTGVNRGGTAPSTTLDTFHDRHFAGALEVRDGHRR